MVVSNSMREASQTGVDAPPADFAERCFNVLVLVFLTGAFMNLFLTQEQVVDPGEGVAGARYMWGAIYVGVIILWSRHCKGSLKRLWNERAIVVLVSLAIVSAVWSDSSSTTLRRSFALVGTCLIALYFAVRFTIREQLKLLVWACGICVAFSLVFGLFHWGRSVDDLEGAWYGVYTQRNALGSMMALSVLLLLLWAKIQRASRWVCWIFAAAAFTLIILSGSLTSLIVFFVLLASFPMIRFLRHSQKPGTVIVIATLCVVGIVLWSGASWDTSAEAMGRDPSLTGRTELWATSALIGLDRPWLGYGYNAFWLGIDGQSADVWKAVGWAAPNAHNGLLEIWLDLGTIGVAVAVFSLGSSLRKAFHLVRETRAMEFAWPLLFLIVLIVLNLTESAFLEGNSIYWFLYVVAALDLSEICRRQPAIATEVREA